MRDVQEVYTSANRFREERSGVVVRLIASSPTTVTAISVLTLVSVSETPVVAARRPASATYTATTGAENEACDHGDHDYRHD